MKEGQDNTDAVRWFETAASETASDISRLLDEKSKTDHGHLPKPLVIVLYRQALDKVDTWLAGLGTHRPPADATEVSLEGYGALFLDQEERFSSINNPLTGAGSGPTRKTRGRRPKALQDGGGAQESGQNGCSEEETTTGKTQASQENGSPDSLRVE